MFDKRKIDTAISSIRVYVSDELLTNRKKRGHKDQSEVVNFNQEFGEAEYVIAYGNAIEYKYYMDGNVGNWYSLLLFKIESFTPGKIEYPLFGQPKLVPPQLVVKDQAGKVFDLFEVHRATFADKYILDKEKPLDGNDANGVCMTPCDRLYKLIDVNNIVPECIPYANSCGVKIKPVTRYEAGRFLDEWTKNKRKIARAIREDYLRVTERNKIRREKARKAQTETQRMLNNLDEMFK